MEHEDPTKKDLSARVIDIVSPIGKGQRALIVSPRHRQDRAAAEHSRTPSPPITRNAI